MLIINKPWTTIWGIWSQYLNTGRSERGSPTGRPRLFTKSDYMSIRNIAESNPDSSNAQIAELSMKHQLVLVQYKGY